MVWRSHTFSPDPTVRGRRGSADDATRVFRVLALWTFPFCHSRSDRFQCGGPVNTLDFHLRSICIQIPSARPVPTRDQSDPPMHPLVYSISIFSLLSAFLAYNTADVGALSTLFALSMGSIGVFGVWAVSLLHFCVHRSVR